VSLKSRFGRVHALHYLANEKLSDELRYRLAHAWTATLAAALRTQLVQASSGCASGIGRPDRRRSFNIEHENA